MKVRLCALIVLLAGLVGCGPSASVTGRVTCQGKPVRGTVLFSPKAEGEANKGPAVSAPLREDGTFTLQLASIGNHSVVITPSDVKYPVKTGERDFPCNRAPTELDIKPGTNVIEINMNEPGH